MTQCDSTDERPAVLVYGHWAQNIGNAFFNVGGEWLLKETLGDRRVVLFSDQPGYRTFHNQHAGNPKNDAHLLEHVDASCVVLQGPMLTTSWAKLWRNAFKRYRDRGTRIVLLGAALFRFTSDEISAVQEFLREYPPAVIVTRDSESFKAVEESRCGSLNYDGIDSAFFWPRAFSPVALDLPEYVTFTFDRFPEPSILPARHASSSSVRIFGKDWELKTPRITQRAAEAGKWQAYFGHLADRRHLLAEFEGRRVIRPEHRTSPFLPWKVYQHTGAMASDEPYTYFTVYSQTSLTLSDRVHACVATLAANNPAMLFTPSPRSRLFDRIGLSDIRHEPVNLDPGYLQHEQQSEITFLRNAFEASGIAVTRSSPRG